VSDQPTTQPCTGPGDRTETTTENGVTRQTWHACPTCHGSH
jgi:hypothetical protein